MILYKIDHPYFDDSDGTKWFETLTNARIAAREIKAHDLNRRVPAAQRLGVVIDVVDIGSLNRTVVVNMLNGEKFIRYSAPTWPRPPA